MKKIILSLLIVATTFSVAQAQVNVGLKGGIGMFNFTGSDAEDGDFKSKIGVMGGVYAAIPLGETFAVAPELQFSGQGAKSTILSTTVKYNVNYLNVPIMLQYRNPSGFFAETGPQVGILMSAKVDAGDGSEDIKDSFKGSAFSWGIGLGFKSSLGVGISARYNLGLGSIAKNDEEDDSKIDIKNPGFQVGLFFEFGGKSGNARK